MKTIQVGDIFAGERGRGPVVAEVVAIEDSTVHMLRNSPPGTVRDIPFEVPLIALEHPSSTTGWREPIYNCAICGNSWGPDGCDSGQKHIKKLAGSPVIQKLALNNDLYPSLDRGAKQLTVRYGYRSVQLGPLVFESTKAVDGKLLYRLVTVERVTYVLAKHVSDEEAALDGFSSAKELIEGPDGLRKYYDDLTMDSVLTVIKFRM